jgi:hypothetical protein
VSKWGLGLILVEEETKVSKNFKKHLRNEKSSTFAPASRNTLTSVNRVGN